jgi:hypothetical protein
MALVDHDEVEEARRELSEQLLAFLRTGDRLIEAQSTRRFLSRAMVRSMVRPSSCSMVLAFGRELRHRGAERTEIIHHGLVDKHVAVGKIEDALLAARLPEPPNDLKRRVGLARAGRHDQQHADLALGDGFDRGIGCSLR